MIKTSNYVQIFCNNNNNNDNNNNNNGNNNNQSNLTIFCPTSVFIVLKELL